MKKVVTAILAGLALVCMMTGPARASLTTIGTATYGGNNYNLIWDNDISVVWLDYSNVSSGFWHQQYWSADLNLPGYITAYNIKPGFTVDWGSSAWRLPSTVNGTYSWGYDGTTTAGYNITNSEMGHLYYTELGNLGAYDTSGNYPQSGYGLENTGDFNHLVKSVRYWSGTEYDTYSSWYFGMSGGDQGVSNKNNENYALALRGANVSAVPVPGAIWLLGSGLLGLLGIRRRRKGLRV